MIRNCICTLFVVLAIVIISNNAEAAQTLTTRASSISEHLKALAQLVQIGFLLLGVLVTGVSLFQLYRAQKSGMPLGPYIGGLAVGVVLTSITGFILMGSETVMGGGMSELDRLGLGR